MKTLVFLLAVLSAAVASADEKIVVLGCPHCTTVVTKVERTTVRVARPLIVRPRRLVIVETK